jgi:uncharacterized membrane protein
VSAAAPVVTGDQRAGLLRSRLSRAVPRRVPRPATLPQALLVALVLLYAGAFTYWTVRNHDGYGTFGFDLGIYDQGVWLLSRFHTPFITIMGRNLFGDHTSFVLLPFVPLYWIAPSAKILLAAQSLALALTAVPIFLIARKRLDDEWLALILAAAVLLQPVLQWTNVEQFHPDAFEVPLAAMALLFMLEQRWTPYFISLGALLSVKEDTPLLVLGIGIYVTVRFNRKVGLITCAAAVGYGLVAVYGVLRALNGIGSLNGWRIPFGGVGGVVRTALAHPVTFFRYLGSDQRPWYLWQLFAPLAVIPVLAPDFVLLALGPFASNLISNFYYQHRIQYHYSTQIVPVLAVATVIAISRLRWEFVRYVAVGTVAFVSVLAAYLWGPMPWARHPTTIGDPSTAAVASVNRAMEHIPDGAIISAYYSYVPHLDHRRQVYEFPVPWHAQYWGTFTQEGQRLPQADDVQYVIVPPSIPDQTSQDVLDSLRTDFRPIYRSPYVVVLQRMPQ